MLDAGVFDFEALAACRKNMGTIGAVLDRLFGQRGSP